MAADSVGEVLGEEEGGRKEGEVSFDLDSDELEFFLLSLSS